MAKKTATIEMTSDHTLTGRDDLANTVRSSTCTVAVCDAWPPLRPGDPLYSVYGGNGARDVDIDDVLFYTQRRTTASVSRGDDG